MSMNPPNQFLTNPPMTRSVALVTDSTSYLAPEQLNQYAITVVPLRVFIAGGPGGRDAGQMPEIGISPSSLAHVLKQSRSVVRTSRPSSEEFRRTYEQILTGGASQVVSIHLSSKMSGTYESAAMAARSFGGAVVVVDSESIAMGLGFQVMAAAHAAQSGFDAGEVVARAATVRARTSAFFSVESLAYLRRGGRLTVPKALLGTVLDLKPILRIRNGGVVVAEKVRNSSRALNRLVELAVGSAQEQPCDLVVHHLAAVDRAAQLHDLLLAAIPTVRSISVAEVGATVGAHAGPGLLGVVVSRHD